MRRVVRPGGQVVLLEFHWVRGLGALDGAFALYFRRILPRLGAWVCGADRGGYAYLVASIDAFGPAARVAAIRPPRVLQCRVRNPKSRILHQLARLPAADLDEIVRCCQERLKTLRPAAARMAGPAAA